MMFIQNISNTIPTSTNYISTVFMIAILPRVFGDLWVSWVMDISIFSSVNLESWFKLNSVG